jgi:hypothetical protein
MLIEVEGVEQGFLRRRSFDDTIEVPAKGERRVDTEVLDDDIVATIGASFAGLYGNDASLGANTDDTAVTENGLQAQIRIRSQALAQHGGVEVRCNIPSACDPAKGIVSLQSVDPTDESASMRLGEGCLDIVLRKAAALSGTQTLDGFEIMDQVHSTKKDT